MLRKTSRRCKLGSPIHSVIHLLVICIAFFLLPSASLMSCKFGAWYTGTLGNTKAIRRLAQWFRRSLVLLFFVLLAALKRLNLLMQRSIVYSKIQVVTHHYQRFSISQYSLQIQVQAQQWYSNALTQIMIP
ncbi:hypothetical protein H5410_041402 [Solanum commersonii]|uniref:Uncharacterized protein n=1 Tax=Solanum commersonii TaxID=4109 RepID=A0A9J5XUN1_SOLCO|nr:hypothetical protein H5410_041402 [Solanum commersonii]